MAPRAGGREGEERAAVSRSSLLVRRTIKKATRASCALDQKSLSIASRLNALCI